jgi:hypothetical protein
MIPVHLRLAIIEPCNLSIEIPSPAASTHKTVTFLRTNPVHGRCPLATGFLAKSPLTKNSAPTFSDPPPLSSPHTHVQSSPPLFASTMAIIEEARVHATHDAALPSPRVPPTFLHCRVSHLSSGADYVTPLPATPRIEARPGTGSGSYGSANPRDYSGSDSVSWVRTLESQVIAGSGP